MKKVLLVAPKVLSDLAGDLYNLASLATYIENICEVQTVSYASENFASTLKKFNPDIVGVTSYTTTYPDVIAIMQEVKTNTPNALRLIGGVHISCLPESLHPVFDAGIIGDGEEVLANIVAGKSTSIQNYDGLCYFKNGKITVNPPRTPVKVEKLPIPNLKKYAKTIFERGSVGFVTSRGCPFRCTFCYSKTMHNQPSYYPIDWIADHFEYVTKELKAKYIFLWDDTICNNLNRLSKLADELEKRRLPQFNVAINMRSSIISEELCQVLKRLKVVSWNCGFESGSDIILKQIKGEQASVEKHKEIVHLSHKFKFKLFGSFIFGMPNESLHNMTETLEFMEWILKEKQAGRFNGGLWFFCASPLPATKWWNKAFEQGKVSFDMDWTKLSLTNWQSHLLLEPTITEKQFFNIRLRAEELTDKINK